MRVLVTTSAGLGHVLPVLPLASALRQRGHEVRWAVGPGHQDPIVAAGIEVLPSGMSVEARHAELDRRYPSLGTMPVGERRPLMFRGLFGEIGAPAMLEDLEPIVANWTPDLVLHEAAELAGPLVAARLGIPSVCHGFGEIVGAPTVRGAAAATAPLWEAAGLSPDEFGGSYRGLYVDIYPPSLRNKDQSHAPRVQLLRPAEGVPAQGGLVYVTFGTVFNRIDDGFRAAVLGAAAVADEVLVTVGPAGDPSAVGDVPRHIAVERFVPQAEVLPRCAAVVSHAGSGTVLAALAYGVPLVCLPRAADQWDNAANVARVGAGVTLAPDEVTLDAVRDAVASVAGDRPPRAAARALAAEIAAMPSVEEVADVAETLV